MAVHLAVTTAADRHTYALVFVGLAFFSRVTPRLAKNLWGHMHVGLPPPPQEPFGENWQVYTGWMYFLSPNSVKALNGTQVALEVGESG